MSDTNSSPHDGGDKAVRRNLPSWMSSRNNGDKSRPQQLNEEDENPDKVTGHVKAHRGITHSKGTKCSEKSANKCETSSGLGTLSFSKLMEGVIFVLSGFVNPERSILRSQALEMGGQYQPDWNSSCTLLICAFPNTPKFRQVEADCGTIVSKEWISECYNQKKLVPIETYLMHAGNPWRRNSLSHEASEDQKTTPPSKSPKKIESSPHRKPSVSVSSEGGVAPIPGKEHLSPSQVKKWAINDLNKTISWLESQEERPEASEIKKIAAEGILTCLNDAIESLKQNQDIRQVTEQWKFIPRVVEELAKLEDLRSSSTQSLSKEDLYQQAMTCKHIYEMEFGSLDDDSNARKKMPKTEEGDRDIKKTKIKSVDVAYDSDETIEMTEEEIDLAYKTVSSKLCK